MSGFLAALWAEGLKARRSKVSGLTAAGLLLLPLIAGLFMLILKDPARARALGLLGAKAQLVAGAADWPTLFGMLAQGLAIGGGVVFAIATAWVFGREFADRTAKELLAVPASRTAVVAAKFVTVAAWIAALTLLVFAAGVAVGAAVRIPGWSPGLAWAALRSLLVIGLLVALLMPLVAWVAGVGRGYLAPLGWAFLTLVVAQVGAALGWGDLVPWSVPALLAGTAGPAAARLGAHSFAIVALTGIAGLLATFTWWRRADHAR
jgi:ABC-2 type transport system permease protein